MTLAKNVVVLGASGHIGQAVTRELAGRGCSVTAATRRTAIPELAALGVTVAPGDADAPGQLDRWVEGHDAVVDAAAPHPLSIWVPDEPVEHDPVRYASHRTHALLGAVSRHGAQLAFVSSFSTLPHPQTGLPARETSTRHRLYPYFRVKQMMEDIVIASAREGLPVVVVNPSACLGPWDNKREESSLVQMVLAERLPSVIRHVVNVIDVRDVATGIVAALEAKRYGVPIPLAGHNIALDVLVCRIAELGGVRPPAFVTNARLTAVAAYWGELAFAALGRPAPHALRAVPLIADSWPMEPSAEQLALRVSIRGLDETLRDTVRWQLSSGRG
jgi:dihydroflavonol-4-reductase